MAVNDDLWRLGYMGAFFGVASRRDISLDVFFGVDYHSHLGTRRAGMVMRKDDGSFEREIHSIQNTPFRTKFEGDLPFLEGTVGFGIIRDADPQPIIVRSHLGVYALATVGAIGNTDEIIDEFTRGGQQFTAMSSGEVNMA
jgi:amidophosphoribosyltransferase